MRQTNLMLPGTSFSTVASLPGQSCPGHIWANSVFKDQVFSFVAVWWWTPWRENGVYSTTNPSLLASTFFKKFSKKYKPLIFQCKFEGRKHPISPLPPPLASKKNPFSALFQTNHRSTNTTKTRTPTPLKPWYNKLRGDFNHEFHELTQFFRNHRIRRTHRK